MPTPEDITRHHDAPSSDERSPWVEGYAPPPLEFEVEEYDAAWPARFEELAVGIRGALGDRILSLGHVGSTSVPGLPAKPVIDMDLVVADPSDEAAYIPALTELGYRHVVREPWWHADALVDADALRLRLRPFQIVTIRIARTGTSA